MKMDQLKNKQGDDAFIRGNNGTSDWNQIFLILYRYFIAEMTEKLFFFDAILNMSTSEKTLAKGDFQIYVGLKDTCKL